MRPVNRGQCPQVATAGGALADKVFTDYKNARPDLKSRIGAYCSFCGVALNTSAELEHILGKDANPLLRCTWSNFLLACKSCNTTKSTKVTTTTHVEANLWPHLDHTFVAFIYRSAGRVEIADTPFAAKAQSTADMVGLTKRPKHGLAAAQVNSGSDTRYLLRGLAWEEAVLARDDLADEDTPKIRRYIVKLAQQHGFWSVWMTIFAKDKTMCAALCQAFPNTAVERIGPAPDPQVKPAD